MPKIVHTSAGHIYGDQQPIEIYMDYIIIEIFARILIVILKENRATLYKYVNSNRAKRAYLSRSAIWTRS